MSSIWRPDDGERMSRTVVLYLIHHIFLPSALPQTDDFQAECQAALLRLTWKNLTKFRLVLPPEDHDSVITAAQMLYKMQAIHTSSGDVSEVELRKALGRFDEGGKGMS